MSVEDHDDDDGLSCSDESDAEDSNECNFVQYLDPKRLTDDSEEIARKETISPAIRMSATDSNLPSKPKEGKIKGARFENPQKDDKSSYEVRCGRGIRIHNYPGNKRFHNILNSHREEYQCIPRSGKSSFIKKIVKEVKQKGLRFMNRTSNEDSGDEGSWEVMDDAFIYEKISHGLRRREHKPKARKRTIQYAAAQQNPSKPADSKVSSSAAVTTPPIAADTLQTAPVPRMESGCVGNQLQPQFPPPNQQNLLASLSQSSQIPYQSSSTRNTMNSNSNTPNAFPGQLPVGFTSQQQHNINPHSTAIYLLASLIGGQQQQPSQQQTSQAPLSQEDLLGSLIGQILTLQQQQPRQHSPQLPLSGFQEQPLGTLLSQLLRTGNQNMNCHHLLQETWNSAPVVAGHVAAPQTQIQSSPSLQAVGLDPSLLQSLMVAISSGAAAQPIQQPPQAQPQVNAHQDPTAQSQQVLALLLQSLATNNMSNLDTSKTSSDRRHPSSNG